MYRKRRQPVISLGYATGISAILARAGDDAVDDIVKVSGGDPTKITGELLRRKLIRPLVTQGHIGDVLADKIVYDAQTTSGHSIALREMFSDGFGKDLISQVSRPGSGREDLYAAFAAHRGHARDRIVRPRMLIDFNLEGGDQFGGIHMKACEDWAEYIPTA